MKLEHGFTVPVAVDDAWRVLLDVEQVAPCMPGASLESVDGDDFSGKVKVKVGPITVTYRGTASFTDKDETAHRAVIKAKGKEARGSGTASATVTTSMSEQGGSTKVSVSTDLSVTGKPAQFGRGVMADVGEKLIGRFASCLADKIEAGEVGAGSGAAGGGGDGASAAAPSGDLAASGEAADGHREGTTAVESGAAAPAGAVPPGPTVSSAAASEATTPVAGTATGQTAFPLAAPPAPARSTSEAEPIDLFDTAGLPVLRRAAPVVGGLAAIAAAVALIRRARR